VTGDPEPPEPHDDEHQRTALVETDPMKGSYPMKDPRNADADAETLRSYPKRGTRVRRPDTGQRGRYTGNGGRIAGQPIALVWWDDRPHEDLVNLYALQLDDEGDVA
jgi:hypothetical protein